jgi:beta-galactosidase/beta-glucuronidase
MARERLESLSRQLIPSSLPPKSLTSSHRRSTIPLDKGWVFRQADRDDLAQTFCTTSMFPTNVYLDLLLHGLIPDPSVGMKEKEIQWVGEKTWIYKCSFQVAPHWIKRFRGAVMVFDGLDIFAKVKLDGLEVLCSSNMFMSHRVDVRHLLDREWHSLEITFESATEMGRKAKGHEQLPRTQVGSLERRSKSNGSEEGTISLREFLLAIIFVF